MMDRREAEQEIESLDIESQNVAALLGGLRRVEAPPNFEFGVRARIANGAPTRRSSVVPLLKIAAPLALVLIVAMIVIFYPTSPDHATVAVVPPEAPSTIGRNEVSNNSELILTPRDPEPAEPVSVSPLPEVSKPALPAENSNSRRRPKRQNPPSSGGSEQFMLTPTNTINPPEFRQGTPNVSNSNAGTQLEVSVREVLDILGVSVDSADESLRVKATVDGSVARKSGVQAGDVIEAIDGRAVNGKTTFRGTASSKTIRVRRDGKSLDLRLIN